MPKPYVVDTDKPTKGKTWRETPYGNRYASVTFADGRKYHVAVERNKRVRIPFKPRGTYGWTYLGSVRDATGRYVVSDAVAGSIGVPGLLKMACLIGPAATAP